MAQEARKIVEEYMNAFANNDQERLKELVAEDGRFIGQPPGFGDDRDGLLKLAEHYDEALGDKSVKLDHWVVGEEGRVAAHFTGRGTHKGNFLGIEPTNKEIEVEGLVLCQVRDGKIVEDITEVDAMGMLGQMDALPERLTVTS
jgi:predicted ester cyclase